MVGTAGNLSARLPDRSFWITASGKNKGALTTSDFIRVGADGAVLEAATLNTKPSAETSIHQTLYDLFPEAQACYHVHSIEANLAAQLTDQDDLPLPPLEMLKGFRIEQEQAQVSVSIVPNYDAVNQIAAEVRSRFTKMPPTLPVLLIRHHGATVWAPSLTAAHNYVELSEYIFRYIVAAHQLSLI